MQLFDNLNLPKKLIINKVIIFGNLRQFSRFLIIYGNLFTKFYQFTMKYQKIPCLQQKIS